MKKESFRPRAVLLGLALAASPGLRAHDVAQGLNRPETAFALPSVTLADLNGASLRVAPPFKVAAVAPASTSSIVEQWKRSVEYAVLLKQNGWKGWTYASAGTHPEFEWVEAFGKPSSEYRRLCEESYRLGWKAVEAAAKSRAGESAVVLDIDETVLLTVAFQRMIAGSAFDLQKWEAWMRCGEARAVPGAKAFLDKVRGLGKRVHIVYLSDRPSGMDPFTLENLRKLGLFQEGDILLSKKDKADTKEVRRLCVRSGKNGSDARCKTQPPMTILAQFGDSLRDHAEVYGREAADKTLGDSKWGKENFMLPNPMYGQWMWEYR